MRNKQSVTSSYSLLQFSCVGLCAVMLTFAGNFFYDLGFTGTHVSLMLGIATAWAFAMQLAVAELSNRYPRFQVWKLTMLMGLTMTAGNILIFLPGFPAVGSAISYGVCVMLLQMTPILANAVGMDAIRRGSRTNYSLARGIGSMGYAVMSLLTGAAVMKGGVMMVPLLGAALALAQVFSVAIYHFHSEKQIEASDYCCVLPEQKQEEPKKNFLKTYPRFAAFLLGTLLLNLSHGLVCTFMFQIMQEKNGGAAEQGIAMALCAIGEFPLGLMYPMLQRRIRCDRLMRVGALGIAVKPIGLLLVHSPEGVYLTSLTQLIGFSLFMFSSVNYAEKVVKRGESVRAQSYLGATSLMGGLVASFLGGPLCQYFGVQVMIAISVATALIGGIGIALAAEKTQK